MALKKFSDEEIIAAMKKFGSSKLAAEHIGISVRALCHRKAKIQEQYGVVLPAYSAKQHTVANTYIPDNRRVIQHTVDNGHVFIASDCHYWPGESTVAHKAFVKLLTEFKPKTAVLNGDVFDGARISRHAALMGTNPPTPKQEIEACQDRLDEIAKASKNAIKLWTYGNHDIRLFNFAAQNAPELSEFTDLFSYFPGWHTGWRVEPHWFAAVMQPQSFQPTQWPTCAGQCRCSRWSLLSWHGFLPCAPNYILRCLPR